MSRRRNDTKNSTPPLPKQEEDLSFSKVLSSVKDLLPQLNCQQCKRLLVYLGEIEYVQIGGKKDKVISSARPTI